jgi:hypothetical protein
MRSTKGRLPGSLRRAGMVYDMASGLGQNRICSTLALRPERYYHRTCVVALALALDAQKASNGKCGGSRVCDCQVLRRNRKPVTTVDYDITYSSEPITLKKTS